VSVLSPASEWADDMGGVCLIDLLFRACFYAFDLLWLNRRIRHPMYLALALYSIGQALVIPNWVWSVELDRVRDPLRPSGPRGGEDDG